jgi:hypothetical protein
VTTTIPAYTGQNLRLLIGSARYALRIPFAFCPDAIAGLPDFVGQIDVDCPTCGTPMPIADVTRFEDELANGKVDLHVGGIGPLTRVRLGNELVLLWDRPSAPEAPNVATGPTGPGPNSTIQPISQFVAAVQRANVCAPCTPPADCDTGIPGGPRGFLRLTAPSCEPVCPQLREQFCPATDAGTSGPSSAPEGCECADYCCPP